MSAAAKPVDIAHLDRYTGGDAAINAEVLRLFEGQCREIVARLESLLSDGSPGDLARKWHEAAHALKGAARGIGAFALADAACDAEKAGVADRMTAFAALERVKTGAESVHLFIQEVLDTEN